VRSSPSSGRRHDDDDEEEEADDDRGSCVRDERGREERSNLGSTRARRVPLSVNCKAAFEKDSRCDAPRREEEREMTRRRRWPWALVGLIPVLMPAVPAAQERPYEWGWGMHPMWGVWGAWGIGMMLMMLVFWGMVIVGIVLAIRWFASQGKEFRSSDTALDILRERYARGDISREEFDAKKRDLT
jgi:putative membrane protein